jgi:hypothetical protein
MTVRMQCLPLALAGELLPLPGTPLAGITVGDSVDIITLGPLLVISGTMMYAKLRPAKPNANRFTIV